MITTKIVKNVEISPIFFIRSMFFILVMTYYTLVQSNIYKNFLKLLLGVAICFAFIYFLLSLTKTVKGNIDFIIKSVLLFLLIGGFIFFELYIHGDTRISIVFLASLLSINFPQKLLFKQLFFTKFIVLILVFFTGGYRHINLMALHTGIVILLYVCKKENNKPLSWINFIVLSIVYIALSIYTDSGAFKIGIGFMLFLEFLFKIKKVALLKNKMIILIYPILFLLNLYLVISVYAKEMPYIGQYMPDCLNKQYLNFVKSLNDIMSGRLSLGNFSLNYFGVSWIGGNVQFDSFSIGGNYFNLDSGFMWLLQGNGILMTIVFMILTIILMRYLIKNNMNHCIIVSMVLALWAISEDMLVSVGTNFMLILIGSAVVSCLTRKENYVYSKVNSLLLVWR